MSNTLFHSGLVVDSPTLGAEEAVAYSVGWDAQVKQMHIMPLKSKTPIQ